MEQTHLNGFRIDTWLREAIDNLGSSTVRAGAKLTRHRSRMWLGRALLLLLLICLPNLSLQAQQEEPVPQNVYCRQAWNITRENAKGENEDRTWTSPISTHDGLLNLTYCGLFKDGATTINRLTTKDLNELPSGFEPHTKYAELVREKIQLRKLPIGFSVYNDMAFEIQTDAVPNGMYLMLRLPSVQNEEVFKKLAVFYLDEDQMLPGALQWRNSYRKADESKSNFKERTLYADFDFTSLFNHNTYIGRVVVASFDEAEYDKSALDLGIDSVIVPPVVHFGETFTYSIAISNGGTNRRTATEVVFNSIVSGAEFVAASSDHGKCRKSVNSDPVVVCELGTLDPTSKVVIKITVVADEKLPPDRNAEQMFMTANIVKSREKDSIPENNSSETSTIIH